jgi:hypothetical protein
MKSNTLPIKPFYMYDGRRAICQQSWTFITDEGKNIQYVVSHLLYLDTVYPRIILQSLAVVDDTMLFNPIFHAVEPLDGQFPNSMYCNGDETRSLMARHETVLLLSR